MSGQYSLYLSHKELYRSQHKYHLNIFTSNLHKGSFIYLHKFQQDMSEDKALLYQTIPEDMYKHRVLNQLGIQIESTYSLAYINDFLVLQSKGLGMIGHIFHFHLLYKYHHNKNQDILKHIILSHCKRKFDLEKMYKLRHSTF